MFLKRNGVDYVTFARDINRKCDKFQLQSITEDQFKCLIFIVGLSRDSDVRTRQLSKLEQDIDVKIKVLTNKCQNVKKKNHHDD